MEAPRKVSGPVFGYRAWRLNHNGLYSFKGWRPWPHDRTQAALCWKNFFPISSPHRAPGVGCTCGIYAWKSPMQYHTPQGMTPVRGVVELGGRVVVHASGYRAEYARPVAVEYVPGVEEVARRYGLVVLTDLKEWTM